MDRPDDLDGLDNRDSGDDEADEEKQQEQEQKKSREPSKSLVNLNRDIRDEDLDELEQLEDHSNLQIKSNLFGLADSDALDGDDLDEWGEEEEEKPLPIAPKPASQAGTQLADAHNRALFRAA